MTLARAALQPFRLGWTVVPGLVGRPTQGLPFYLEFIERLTHMPALTMLRRLIELRDGNLLGHEQRLGRYASTLCSDLNLDPEYGHAMGQACSFHDLGKVVLPDAVLLKPAALTPSERDIMRNHCLFGHEILKQGKGAVIRLAASIALTHHECFDGSGYPSGLQGDNIPLEGRIASICDVYDALREHRVYRQGLTHEHAMDIILNGDGQTRPTQFDPQVRQAFANHSNRYAELFEELQGASLLIHGDE